MKEIRELLTSYKLEGRTIKDIRFVSHAYNLTREALEDYAYSHLTLLPEEERQKKSEYHNIDPNMLFPRFASLDEPLLVWFDDNDHLEIDTPQEPEFRISMNCIPWWIEPGVNLSNAEAKVLFDLCIGKRISSVEVVTYKTKLDPMFNEEFNDGEERELVASVIIWLEDEIGLSIGPRIDYMYVGIVNKNKDLVKIPFEVLKHALFNWEDIHDDEEICFSSECKSFWFGKRGKEIISSPYLKIMPEGQEHCLMVSEEDDTFLFLAFSAALNEQFDVYEDYEYSYEQWDRILNTADYLMGFETFDSFFDYLLEVDQRADGKCDLLYCLNHAGADIWRKKWLHEKEAADLRRWTAIVRKPDQKMIVYGY